MTRVLVLGAGVVGSCHAALLSRTGHDVALVGRGARRTELERTGLRVQLDATPVQHRVRVDVADAPADVLLVAVRGEQLLAVLDEVVAHPAARVLVFANPLDERERVEGRLGDRLVWCFSGLGGVLRDGEVVGHRVRQQPTVVQAGVPGSADAAALLASIDPHLRREPHMPAWLDTHTVFVAAMAATLLQQESASHPARVGQRLRQAHHLVRALRQAFNALRQEGRRCCRATCGSSSP